DTSGGAIPGVEVTASNATTNLSQTAITNDVGNFTLSNLPNGRYTLRADLTGFREAVTENVIINAGTVVRQDVVLQVGQITETVTVSGTATVLKTDSTDVSAQLETKEITDLPLNVYRNYQALINLVPGATPARFQNAITDTPMRALTTNINGTNRNNNSTRIDGAISVNIWLPHHTGYVPPSETIEVVDISTNNFDAEKGFAGGAATTVITKSGTNEFHGVAFWHHENTALAARDYFLVGDIMSGKRNIYGGTLGGPIMKDKLFFFGGYEATVERTAQVATGTVPYAAEKAGNFSGSNPSNLAIYDPATGTATGSKKTQFPNNIIPADRLNSAAMMMLAAVPLPNVNLGQDVNNFQIQDTRLFNRYNYDAKMDWYRSEEHRIWGKFSNMDALVVNQPMFGWPASGGAIGGGGEGTGDTNIQVWGIGHNWTLSPTFLMDGNFGWTDMDQVVESDGEALGSYGLNTLGIPGVNNNGQDRACIYDGKDYCVGVPRFDMSGYTTLGHTQGWMPLDRNEDSWTLTHNFSWSKGNHELRFGYDLVHHLMDHWQPETGGGPRGVFGFSPNITRSTGPTTPTNRQNALAAFMLGEYNSWNKSLQWELLTTRNYQHAVYLRDRWQASDKLTLTLGVRWEYYPTLNRANRAYEVVDWAQMFAGGPMIMNLEGGADVAVSKKLFGPRVGFAYRLSDSDVIRAGYGITIDPYPLSRPLRGSFPLTIAATESSQTSYVPLGNLTANGIPFFEGPDTTLPTALIPGNVGVTTMPQDFFKRGYIQSWNVMYERKFPAEFVISFGYVGTQTVRSLGSQNMNWSKPGTGNAGRLLNSPAYDNRTATTNHFEGMNSGNYHSLQIAINRRFINGFFVKGAYTYSKAINIGDDAGSSNSFADPAIAYRGRANAGYNTPHVFQWATLYQVPFGSDGNSAADVILKNWQLNGVFSVNSNRNSSVSADGGTINTSGNAQWADQVGEIVNLGNVGIEGHYYDPSSFAQPNRVPGVSCTDFDCYGTSGRNIIRGPTWVNLDLSLFRSFNITEWLRGEFRAEAFNITNTPKFSNPNFSVTSSNFMKILSTTENALSRSIRFGIKFAW
ncbi:MAG: TonB-dependent receptor, partial [Acidobacteriota bacterium]